MTYDDIVLYKLAC